MICLVGKLPVLQVGHHQVIGYETKWIDDALARAATAANRDDFPFIDEIRDGVLHYMEHRCALRVLPIEDLFARMRGMLKKIGCPAIAQNLEPLAPPVTVSLRKIAQDAGNGFELVFFCLLSEDLNDLRHYGVENIHFQDVEEAAMILRGKQTPTKACHQLTQEIRAFLERYTAERDFPERHLTLTLES